MAKFTTQIAITNFIIIILTSDLKFNNNQYLLNFLKLKHVQYFYNSIYCLANYN